MYTFPSVTVNHMAYTARRWGQFPSITYIIGGTAGSEVVTVAADLSDITIKIEDGVSTNLQIKNAIVGSLTTVDSLFPSDLVSMAIESGHNSDVNTAEVNSMSGAVNVPAPLGAISARPSSIVSQTMIDWSIAKLYRKTLAANTTFTFLNTLDGMEIEVLLTNTASNYTVAWPAGIKWVGGSAPTQTTGAKTDVYRFRQLGTTIYATAVQNLS